MTNGLLGLDHIPLGASTVAVAAQRLAQALRGDLGAALAARGDLSLLEWRICVALARDGSVPQKDIVRFTHMQQAQVSRALTTMEERGLIRSVRGEADRRARLFSLSDEGRRLFDRNLPVVERFGAATDAALSPEERRLFLDMCERMAAASREADAPGGTSPTAARPVRAAVT